jgi:hypothetical protein
MKSEEEIKSELVRLIACPDPLPPNGDLYGESYLEVLTAITRVEKGARIAILKWVLGDSRT